ncbi:hypothetical protein S40288_06136 [Stachybotrys chartarum IBT 40288]|nr:hypothetical protein S40288_06136 [Stachybotrys chartarum IBT 40288]
MSPSEVPPTKRPRPGDDDAPRPRAGRSGEGPSSLTRPISPPTKKKRTAPRAAAAAVAVASPWQLTWIRDLPADCNRDAVTLRDLLGDPLIAECWQFNFLHDIPFIMEAFDPDTRHLVKVHIVHGFWKREEPRRSMLAQEAAEYGNVQLHVAPMPEMFGTHHSKMMVLFRHDDTAQVIIHTANMIPRDWTNMTNGLWKSPLLPKLSSTVLAPPEAGSLPLGSGARFKHDLVNYLRCYDSRGQVCKSLVDKLSGYDFSEIRAAVIASVPGKHKGNNDGGTTWGWPAMQKHLREIPCVEGESEIVLQISSIATLGGTDGWLRNSLLRSLEASKESSLPKPEFKMVFPTADEIRHSLDGYASGGSIHTKVQSLQQKKQLEYLRPILHHWANDVPTVAGSGRARDGGRQRAAPHIKTYIRYNKEQGIDWALLTSANVSKQAWGDSMQSTGEVRIASWEMGVLVWSELLRKESVMVGTFKSDTPPSDAPQGSGDGKATTVIGLRIPYSLPLQRYGNKEMPWVASMAHGEPDWMGRTWEG